MNRSNVSNDKQHTRARIAMRRFNKECRDPETNILDNVKLAETIAAELDLYEGDDVPSWLFEMTAGQK
jgi:hypothetical protein